jgi:hypothetical protein
VNRELGLSQTHGGVGCLLPWKVQMPTATKLADGEGCCRPGDIIVSQVASHGWVLGTAMEHRATGPVWSFVVVFRNFEKALREARILARRKRVRIWRYEGGTTYQRIAVRGRNG